MFALHASPHAGRSSPSPSGSPWRRRSPRSGSASATRSRRRSSSSRAARPHAPNIWPSPTSGRASSCPCMLEGPKAQLDTQGPALVKALAARRDTRVLSAWDIGDTGASLRPDATHAMLVASVAQTEEAMVDGIQQDIDRHRRPGDLRAGDAVHHRHADDRPRDEGPVARRRAAAPSCSRCRSSSSSCSSILRAPVAALVLTAFGGATTLMSFGAMALLGKAIDVDPTAVTLASMAGLALGVSYAMLVYRRWRSERARARRARPRRRGARREPRGRDHRPRGAHRRHGARRGARAGAADRPEHDPHLARHRRHAVLGARDRRRGRRHAGRDDHPRTPPAGVLVRRPGLRDGAVERAREPRRRLGHPQRDRRRRAWRPRCSWSSRIPIDEPRDRARSRRRCCRRTIRPGCPTRRSRRSWARGSRPRSTSSWSRATSRSPTARCCASSTPSRRRSPPTSAWSRSSARATSTPPRRTSRSCPSSSRAPRRCSRPRPRA